MKYNFRKKIRIVLIIVWILSILFFLFKVIIPSGSISYHSKLFKDTSFISKLTPKERVVKKGDNIMITGDPVYFSLYYPRQFQNLDVKVKYKWKNVNKQIFEVGILADKDLWQYNLKPLENTILEDAISNWHLIKEGDILFLQKEKKFANINNFLKSDSINRRTAVYNLKTKDLNLNEFKLSNKEKDKIKETTINQSLRGHHQVYLYHPGGDFNFDLEVLDLNENKDRDDLDMILYYEDKAIASSFLKDDGVSTDSGLKSNLRSVNLNVNNLPEALYKLQIKVNDDIIVKKIKSSTNYLSFINTIYLAKDDFKNIPIYTDFNSIKATTINADSLQTINFAGKDYKLLETYKQHYFRNFENKNIWKEINIEKNGLKLSSNGVFSFNKDITFNPDFIKLNDDINLFQIDYILAKYNPVKKEGDWHIAEASFDLSGVYSEDNKYSIVLSLPNFSYKQEAGLIIDSIDINLQGKNIWQKIREIIK